MKLCNETVTVYNARVDPATRMEVWFPTVLAGVSCFGERAGAAARNGMRAADRFVLRIPEGADAGGKRYAEPEEDRAAEDVDGLWTLRTGDVILRGACAEGLIPSRLRERFGPERVLSVVGVTDNRRVPRARHWRVEGEF